MTTITINERTKAGKTLLELAKMLSATNKGVIIEMDQNEPAVKEEKNKTDEFLKKVRRSAKHAREIGAGTRQGNSLDKLMNEL
ncbi:hypothetical protein [Flavobacterium cellulosilyticum]|uniref:Uncharacterized protein n=1 Tax=Flavobacterium cellulosilyticum TaxID=2541731 RepID=A0A4R5CFH7_9FLAO|nr:hypothetical protein [Flavobacterium cellulosilyticum]TDD97779.1 hypothetical protein E0F76_06635 [Flavobacterium cellulosilyticum]